MIPDTPNSKNGQAHGLSTAACSAFGPDCESWKSFAAKFEMLEGFEPNHRDKTARRLYQYYVAGMWDQHNQQNTEGRHR